MLKLPEKFARKQVQMQSTALAYSYEQTYKHFRRSVSVKPKFSTRVLLVSTLLIAALVMAACGRGEEESADELEVPTEVATFTPAAAGSDDTGSDDAEEEPAEEEPVEEPTEEEPTEEPTAEPTATEAPTAAPTATAEEVAEEEVAAADAITDTEAVTETADVTETEPVAETEPVTETAEITDTNEVAAAEGMTETEAVTETEAATETEATESDGGTASITVDMHDLYFGDENDNIANPPVWTVSAGSEVQLALVNQGGLEHNWAIVEPGAEVPVPYVEEENEDILLYNPGRAQAGETLEATFQAPDVGEYMVICTVAGHYPVMQGRLVVE